jgi:hypothetical protein
MKMTNITGTTETAAVVALAPACTLKDLTHAQGRNGSYFLGGLEAVEEALAKEKNGKGRLEQLMALGLLHDLLRLVPGEGRPEI